MNVKICKTCNIEKDISLFEKRKNNCRKCNSAKRKNRYKEHPEIYALHKEKNIQLRNRQRKELGDKINQFKKKCLYCGYSQFTQCLQFHHLDPSKKESKISKMISDNINEKLILEEIAKCIVLCANCHQAFHNNNIKI